MKAVELRDLSIQELDQRLKDEQENLANLRFQHATNQLESPIKLRLVRKDIARLQTALRQKQAAAVPAAPATTPTQPQNEVKTT